MAEAAGNADVRSGGRGLPQNAQPVGLGAGTLVTRAKNFATCFWPLHKVKKFTPVFYLSTIDMVDRKQTTPVGERVLRRCGGACEDR